ncbi:MAG: cobyric acid synthase CobQ, partial [Clostridia bacterium]|nr:cobyric acid synthase CobQ [Clostridia bacterium]
MEVTFAREKHTAQASGMVECADGWLSDANGVTVDGYEIHAGHNQLGDGAVPWLRIGSHTDGVMNREGNVLGSYLHGLFDDGQLFAAIARHIRQQKGIADSQQTPVSFEVFREREFDRIADIVRASVDMDAIYRIARGEV